MTNGHLFGVVRCRIGELLAEVLADEVGHERHVEGAGVIGRPADHGASDDGPEDRNQRRRARSRRGSAANSRNLSTPPPRPPPSPLPRRPYPPPFDPCPFPGGRRYSGSHGSSCVSSVDRVGLPCVPGASAGAEGHRVVSMSSSDAWSPRPRGRRVRGRRFASVRRFAARASSSSWRMIAAASRSTRPR